MELILDTENKCFLCLQTIHEAPSGPPGSNEMCLKNICRFLQVDPSVVLLKGLQEGQKDASNLLQYKMYNFTVNLCDQCYSIAGKLSSLIHDLEVVQLKVNYYSEAFHGILEGSDLENVKKEPPSTHDGWIVDHLRKETKEKCAARQKGVKSCQVPVVRLKPVKPVPVKMTPVRSGTADAHNNKCERDADAAPPSPCSSSGNFEKERSDSDSNWSLDELPYPANFPANKKSEKSRKTIPPHRSGSSDATTVPCFKLRTHYRCEFCEELVQRKRRRYHVTSMHPEKLLSFAQDGNTCDATFKRLCAEAMEEEVKRCEMVPRKSSRKRMHPSKSPHICYICSQTVTDRRYLRDHFLMQHSNILSIKLCDLQDISPPSGTPGREDLEEEPAEADHPDPLLLPLSPVDVLENHVHSDHVVAPTVTPNQTTTGSQFIPEGDENLFRVNMEEIMGDSLKMCFKPGKNKSYSCLLCSELVKKGSLRKSHLIFEHSETLFSFAKLPHFPEDTFKTLCLQVLESEGEECKMSSGSAMEDTPGDSTLPPYTCHMFHKVCGDPRYLRHHIVNEHADIIRRKLYLLQIDPEILPSQEVPREPGGGEHDMEYGTVDTEDCYSSPLLLSTLLSTGEFSNLEAENYEYMLEPVERPGLGEGDPLGGS